MDVYWLEQTEEDLPKENDWLSGSELSFMEGLRFAKRRADWRLGRWTAKLSLAGYLNAPCSPAFLAKIEIRPAPSGAPEAFLDSKLAAATISLSHRNNRAACAVGPPAVDLGCDLELIEPRSDNFIADYFTPEEQRLVRQQSLAQQSLFLALLWSAKESALKALRTGLRLDTCSVAVELLDSSLEFEGWRALRVRSIGSKVFDGWWFNHDGMVRTVVGAPLPALPSGSKIAAPFPARRSSGLRQCSRLSFGLSKQAVPYGAPQRPIRF
jgi:4'-phosphopantetheinyl transferase